VNWQGSRRWWPWTALGLLSLFGLVSVPAYPVHQPLAPPSLTLLGGADLLGRDLFILALGALRRTLTDVLIAFGIASVLAVGSATLASTHWASTRHLSRSAIGGITAIPPLLVALLAARLLAETGMEISLALALVSWPRLFKLIDAEVQSLRVEPYWLVTTALGLPWRARISRYLTPAVLRALGRIFPMELMELIALHATLAFLGAGALSPESSIGRLIASGRAFLSYAPWMFWTPVLILSLALTLLLAAASTQANERTP